MQFIDEGRIRRIRGISYATRVSPQNANRMVESSRSLLNKFIPDVFIYTDVYRGNESGRSPGFGLSLVAETTNGALYAVECVAKGGETPEDVGLKASKMLYQEISLGGCVDSMSQWIVLLLMVLCPEDVSKTRFGKLSEFSYVIGMLSTDLKGFNFCVI
jgi:RNA 3'-terminal phosphate cyclase-like protein